jgi:hypothetical protein
MIMLTYQERQSIIAEIMQDLGMDSTMSLVVPGDHTMEGKGKYISQFVNAVSLSMGTKKSLEPSTATPKASQQNSITV